MKIAALFLATLSVLTGRLSATELYHLDFTQPEVGTYQVVFGSPTVQSSVGAFTDALVFHAVTSYDQISLPISVSGAQYDIQYDVFAHGMVNSQYEFSIVLDTPLGVVNIGTFANDQVYHFEIFINTPANLWTVAVNGTQRFSQAYNATNLEFIRFSMNPWQTGATDAPGVYAALDNVVVAVVPEPASAILLFLGLGLCAGLFLLRKSLTL